MGESQGVGGSWWSPTALTSLRACCWKLTGGGGAATCKQAVGRHVRNTLGGPQVQATPALRSQPVMSRAAGVGVAALDRCGRDRMAAHVPRAADRRRAMQSTVKGHEHCCRYTSAAAWQLHGCRPPGLRRRHGHEPRAPFSWWRSCSGAAAARHLTPGQCPCGSSASSRLCLWAGGRSTRSPRCDWHCGDASCVCSLVVKACCWRSEAGHSPISLASVPHLSPRGADAPL